jgi:protocatechuate 3,4-dioxygenase beta subunit
VKRRVRVVVAIIVVFSVAAISRVCQRAAVAPAPERGSVVDRQPGGSRGPGRAYVDPRSQPRGAIRGTIRDAAQAPIAQARVCGDASSPQLSDTAERDAICSTTDEQGRYQLGDLIAADYTVYAAARQFRPAAFHPGPSYEHLAFPLAAGEVRSDVDVVLQGGGVEVTGVVLDLTGGPVSHARVRASQDRRSAPWPSVEADDQGRFSLWVEPGSIWVSASADGYAPGWAAGNAPGVFEILLTPAASLAGHVIDAATQKPIAGARVEVETPAWLAAGKVTEITDADGGFRFNRLRPGRFDATATTDHGYGRTAGSVLVGLGQHVDGVVIQVFPARTIAGKIVVGATHQDCRDGSVELADSGLGPTHTTHREADGQQVVGGVRPGTYEVTVDCVGYRARDRYDAIVVGDADLTGLVWEVEPGATLRGKVVTKSGQRVAGAALEASLSRDAPGDPTDDRRASSRSDGSFDLAGLRGGTYHVTIDSADGSSPGDGYPVEVPAGATVDHDFVLDDGGALTGTIVDQTGAPVAGATISVDPPDPESMLGVERGASSATGGFAFAHIAPGDYQVTAWRGRGAQLRKPGTTGDARQGEPVTVRAAQATTVRLVVEVHHGTIRGTVVDAAGKPVGDAFVSWRPESDVLNATPFSMAGIRDEWWDEAKPVLTATDGRFALTELAAGSYRLRVYRKGGGEATVEHVAVGAVVALQIKSTGSIEGTAREGGAPPIELSVWLRDGRTGLQRTETFYRTAGHFVIADLPAGHFDLVVAGGDGQHTIAVDLADGEAKTGVDVALEPLITLSGRLVESGSHKPVAGIFVFVDRGRGELSFATDMGLQGLSDAGGRFSVSQAPAGTLTIHGMPRQDTGGAWAAFAVVRTANGTGTVDVGDIEVSRN